VEEKPELQVKKRYKTPINEPIAKESKPSAPKPSSAKSNTKQKTLTEIFRDNDDDDDDDDDDEISPISKDNSGLKFYGKTVESKKKKDMLVKKLQHYENALLKLFMFNNGLITSKSKVRQYLDIVKELTNKTEEEFRGAADLMLLSSTSVPTLTLPLGLEPVSASTMEDAASDIDKGQPEIPHDNNTSITSTSELETEVVDQNVVTVEANNTSITSELETEVVDQNVVTVEANNTSITSELETEVVEHGQIGKLSFYIDGITKKY
jgi:hypothetical protein